MRRRMGKGFLVVVAFLVLAAVVAMKSDGRADNTITKAVAVLHPTEGNAVKGAISFVAEKKGVRVTGQIEGLAPGKHGFHVHEFGDCSAPDGASAGGHFNPAGMPHGGPGSEKHHIGDLGNIEAPETGPARYEAVIDFLTLDGPDSIVGRSVIIHAGTDDLTSQPAGGAGARVACGVIGVEK